MATENTKMTKLAQMDAIECGATSGATIYVRFDFPRGPEGGEYMYVKTMGMGGVNVVILSPLLPEVIEPMRFLVDENGIVYVDTKAGTSIVCRAGYRKHVRAIMDMLDKRSLISAGILYSPDKPDVWWV